MEHQNVPVFLRISKRYCHMSKFFGLFFIVLLITNCNSSKVPKGYFVETENRYDTINGKAELSGQILRLRRSSDSLVFTETVKVNNYNDDYKIFLMTGIAKKDGLKEFSLDSIFYDNKKNDTLKRSYIFRNDCWKLTQYFFKSFRQDNQIEYFKTERPNDSAKYRKEIFYAYDILNRLTVETEYECPKYSTCDSTYRKLYFRNSDNKIDSTQYYIWQNANWIYRRTFFKTKNGR
jgi:hypothetical protein